MTSVAATRPARPATAPLATVIVGFGKAGRSLHLPSVLHARRLCRDEGLFSTSRPVAVDPRLEVKPRMRDDRSVLLVRSLDAAPDLDPGSTVAHVCTPPLARIAALRALADRGIRHVVCEKPIAASLDELRGILDLVRERGLDIAVVSPWLSSSLTARLADLIGSGALGALRSIRVVQTKPRFSRTRDNVDHPSAFEVEIPHSMGLLLHLAGDAEVEHAAATDMELEGERYLHLGGAHVRLRHASGVVSEIACDLTAPVRERSLSLEFERGVVRGWYSVGADAHAQIEVHRDGAPPASRDVLVDEHLTSMVIAWYQHFAGAGPRPVSDLAFNVRVMDAIAAAKRRAGIEEPGRIIRPPVTEMLR